MARDCGRVVGELNHLGGQPLVLDPEDGVLGLICNGFVDETGERIDCCWKRTWERAERFGRAYGEGKAAARAAQELAKKERAERRAEEKRNGNQRPQVRLRFDGGGD